MYTCFKIYRESLKHMYLIHMPSLKNLFVSNCSPNFSNLLDELLKFRYCNPLVNFCSKFVYFGKMQDDAVCKILGQKKQSLKQISRFYF